MHGPGVHRREICRREAPPGMSVNACGTASRSGAMCPDMDPGCHATWLTRLTVYLQGTFPPVPLDGMTRHIGMSPVTPATAARSAPGHGGSPDSRWRAAAGHLDAARVRLSADTRTGNSTRVPLHRGSRHRFARAMPPRRLGPEPRIIAPEGRGRGRRRATQVRRSTQGKG
jgi:hypothetical protein